MIDKEEIKNDLTLGEYIREQSRPKIKTINPYYPLTADEYVIIKQLRNFDILLKNNELGELWLGQYTGNSPQEILWTDFSMFNHLFDKANNNPFYIKPYLAKLLEN